jgi:hypothetical protein
MAEVVVGAGTVPGPQREEFPIPRRQRAVGQERAGENRESVQSLGWWAIVLAALNGFPAYIQPLAGISAPSGAGCSTGSMRGFM